MAAANENQGLKIAVAAFVSLTVILAVATYFGYSSYSQTYAKMQDAQKAESTAKQLASTAQTQFGELRGLYGYPNIEDFEALKAAIKKDNDKLLEDLNEVAAETKKFTDAYTAAGGNDPKVKELANAAESVIVGLRDEPNKTAASSLNRMRELLKSETLLAHSYAVDNLMLRKDLEGSNTVNQAKLDEQIAALNKSKQDLDTEHNEHEKGRQDLLAKVDKLQTDLSNIQTEYENFKTKSNLMKEDFEKKITDFRNQVAYYKDLYEQKETVMDKPDGVVIAIDYTRNEVRTNLTRGMGVRPQMKFAVFDKREPIPNTHPKAHLELIQVDDRGSIAKILPQVRTGQNLQSSADIQEPIHLGDFVYSNAWSPENPQRFALIGRIDMDRDGRDDREDLKRLIRAAGGVIEYDLPPPGAGKESGKLSPLCSYFVTDTRSPLSDVGRERKRVISMEEQDFLKRESEILKEARSLGIRPMPIDRLLVYLGYSPNMVNYGRVEHLDRRTSESILYPRGRVPMQGQPAEGAAPAGGDTPPAAPGDNAPAGGNEPADNGAAAPK